RVVIAKCELRGAGMRQRDHCEECSVGYCKSAIASSSHRRSRGSCVVLNVAVSFGHMIAFGTALASSTRLATTTSCGSEHRISVRDGVTYVVIELSQNEKRDLRAPSQPSRARHRARVVRPSRWRRRRLTHRPRAETP